MINQSVTEGSVLSEPSRQEQNKSLSRISLQAIAAEKYEPARPTRLRKRHKIALIAGLIFVALPTAVIAAYLWLIAEDQYVSHVAFSVRNEDTNSALEFISGLTSLSGSSSSDMDVLYNYIQSQPLVQDIDDELDLVSIWSKPEHDFFFRYNDSGAIEDLVEYWNSMVALHFDRSAGILQVEVLAFTPQDSQRIASSLFEKSNEVINRLSDIAREDTIRFAKEELDTSIERLKQAREGITKFRNENQLVDPSVDFTAQAGVIGMLQEQLAEARVQLELLKETSNDNDPRIIASRRKIDVLEATIENERAKVGFGSRVREQGEVLADIVGEYERLQVDLEFAQEAYIHSLAAYHTALAEARRQSRYLGAYIKPTLPSKSTRPNRWTISIVTSCFLLLSFSVVVLSVYSFKDRR